MAILFVKNLMGGNTPVAPPKDVLSYPMTENEDAVEGAAYYFSSGRLTVASTQKNIAVIALESADGGGDSGSDPTVFTRAQWITPGMVFKAPITNKAGTGDQASYEGNFIVGATVNLNDKGEGLDAETDLSSVAGPCTILKIDSDNDVAWFVFNSCAVASDLS